jgi:putative SOS response-associated peptidase YedK
MVLMCGRFAQTRSASFLTDTFQAKLQSEELPSPSWNIRVTNQVPIVLESAKGEGEPVRRLESARWSLTPSYSKTLNLSYSTFNARSETAATLRTFKPSLKSKRGILSADYYYEWHKEDDGKTKTPHAIHLPGGAPMAFAGLYSWWPDKSLPEDHPGYWTLTATILTRPAVGEVAWLHHRTPVTLPPEFWDEWLDADTEGDQKLMDAAVAAATPVAESLEFYPVAPIRGNSPENVQRLS